MLRYGRPSERRELSKADELLGQVPKIVAWGDKERCAAAAAKVWERTARAKGKAEADEAVRVYFEHVQEILGAGDGMMER